jgi:hypothetical protein
MSHVTLGASGAGEVVDLIDVIEEIDGVGNIEIVVAELLVRLEVFDVGVAPGDEIIDGDDFMTVSEKSVTEV